MKTLIFFLIIMLASCHVFGKSKKKIKFTRICIYDELYYNWKGRPKFLVIPVLDKNGNTIKCTGDYDGSKKSRSK